jgi:glucose-1-phosphate thymidylyltransferase
VVVGPDDDRTGPAARDWAPEGVEVSVAVQQEPRGSGDALTSAGAALDGRRVVVAAVDTVLRGDLRPHVDAFLKSGRDGWLVLHETDRPREMGIVVLDGDRASYFEEKPDDPPSNLALVGIWMVGPAVVERLRSAPKLSPRGEVELSGTMADMRREGTEIGASVFDGDWLDTGTLRSLLETQRALLDGAESPVLAADATVEDCALGANVVVGSGAVLRDVTLDDALVAPGAHLEGIKARGVVVTPDGEVTQVED